MIFVIAMPSVEISLHRAPSDNRSHGNNSHRNGNSPAGGSTDFNDATSKDHLLPHVKHTCTTKYFWNHWYKQFEHPCAFSIPKIWTWLVSISKKEDVILWCPFCPNYQFKKACVSCKLHTFKHPELWHMCASNWRQIVFTQAQRVPSTQNLGPFF